jgi:Protein of unknown function (DUF1499)
MTNRCLQIIMAPMLLMMSYGWAEDGLVPSQMVLPNQALACPAGICQGNKGLEVPVFGVDAQNLPGLMEAALAHEPRLVMAPAGTDGTAIWTQQTAYLGFTDTITLRYVALGVSRSSVVMASRSNIGLFDFGVNRRRLMRWLDILVATIPGTG